MYLQRVSRAAMPLSHYLALNISMWASLLQPRALPVPSWPDFYWTDIQCSLMKPETSKTRPVVPITMVGTERTQPCHHY